MNKYTVIYKNNDEFVSAIVLAESILEASKKFMSIYNKDMLAIEFIGTIETQNTKDIDNLLCPHCNKNHNNRKGSIHGSVILTCQSCHGIFMATTKYSTYKHSEENILVIDLIENCIDWVDQFTREGKDIEYGTALDLLGTLRTVKKEYNK